ncbi:hypothetical protein Metbo_1330 [Methanobacterium lacus]|uniref:Methanogenesis marker protein 7 n=1 Tax=Methanobacterium lacus (strain AL-21) TaxID=877455 RepID=F0T7K3_METLA|nr:methyl-coenzyme M reductase family protein [Methanobacterium lacus]ADZ09571.1 hypothetical protein Metbo_1330 [Methanobacterium lacus]
MYKIFVFNGGVYRFEELEEFVEDSGGLILRRDDFHVSRGVYFISQEVHVVIIMPEEAVHDLNLLATEIKGDIELIEVDYEDKINLVSLLPIYNILSRKGNWTSIQTIEEILECPCVDGVCQEFEKTSCIDDIKKTLEALSRMEIAESRVKDGNDEFRLKPDE